MKDQLILKYAYKLFKHKPLTVRQQLKLAKHLRHQVLIKQIITPDFSPIMFSLGDEKETPLTTMLDSNNKTNKR